VVAPCEGNEEDAVHGPEAVGDLAGRVVEVAGSVDDGVAEEQESLRGGHSCNISIAIKL
jgi:hypothetical protein